jgi:hypothetical protein
MMFNTKTWKKFDLVDLFEVSLSSGDLKIALCEYGDIPLVSSGSTNNGIVGFIDKKGDGKAKVFEGNKITVDMFCNAFYQNRDFYTVSHGRVNILTPKFEMTPQIGIFIATLIKNENYKYSYGRAVYSSEAERMSIKLPIDSTGKPDWQFMNDYIDKLENFKREGKGSLSGSLKTSNTNVPSLTDTTKWNDFLVDDYFEVKKGKRLTKDDQTEGKTPYIGAIDSNNGVSNYIGQKAIHKGNTISLSYNGSVGEAYYQPIDFWATDDVNVLYPKKSAKLNQYIAMFLCTILRQEKYRYSYGRKWILESMQSTKIKLPKDHNGQPNWKYMENYIKSLPFGDRI